MDIETWIALPAVLISGAALYFTGRAARAAVEQTKIQRQLRIDAAQPYVWVDLRADEATGRLLNLVVGNSGPTVATNVRVQIDPPLVAIVELRDRAETAQSRLADGISSLAPGRILTWPLGQGFNLLKDEGRHTHTFTVTADGPFGQMPEMTYSVDLSDLRGTLDRPAGSLHQLTLAVKDLADRITADRQTEATGEDFPATTSEWVVPTGSYRRVYVVPTLAAGRSRAGLPVSVYLEDGQALTVEAIQSALRTVAQEVGFELVAEFDPVYGSFWQRFRAKVLDPHTQDEVYERLLKLERSVEVRLLAVPESQANMQNAQGLAAIIESLKGESAAVVQLGPLVVIKAATDNRESAILCRTLTPKELRMLETRPGLLKDPSGLMAELTANDQGGEKEAQ